MRADTTSGPAAPAGRGAALHSARGGVRLAAYLVDWLVTVILASVLVSIGGLQLYFAAGRGRHDPSDTSVYAFLIVSLLTVPVWLAMTLIGWRRAGRSVGKLALGLRIVDRRGRRPGVARCVVRLLVYAAESLALLLLPALIAAARATDGRFPGWVTSAAALLLIGALAALAPALVGRRPLHDLAAGTVVVDE